MGEGDDLFGDRPGTDGIESRLLVPQRLAAKACGVSVQAFRTWEFPSHCEVGREVLYNLEDVFRRRLDMVLGRTEALSLEQERARLAREQADKAALENAKRRGELVEIGVAERAWSQFVVGARARMLSLPTKLAAELATINHADTVRSRLESEVTDVLAALAADPAGAAGADGQVGGRPGGGATHATAKANGKRVGRRQSKTKPGKQLRARPVAN